MKKILLYLLLFVAGKEAIASGLFGDKIYLDTIYVSHEATTYLIFPAEVDLLDIGLAEGYHAKIEGKSVFIRAKDSTVPPTNFLIKYGKAYFMGVLHYSSTPRQYLYDFREKELHTNQATTNTLLREKADMPIIENRLAQLASSISNAVLRSRKKDNLRFFLSAVLLDKQAIYLKLGVHNQSSMDFVIDYTSFELVESKGKRFSANNRSIRQRTPLMSIDAEKLPSNQKTLLLYALPSYAMRSKSKLLITIKEASGARVLKLAIPARLLAKSKRID